MGYRGNGNTHVMTQRTAPLLLLRVRYNAHNYLHDAIYLLV